MGQILGDIDCSTEVKQPDLQLASNGNASSQPIGQIANQYKSAKYYLN